MKNFIIKNKLELIYAAGIISLLIGFLFLISVNIIGFSVKTRCQIAQDKYEGDCVEALNSYLDDESNDFKSRNAAIWALGQLGDDRSLDILKKYETGEDKKESLSKALSQREIERAIGYIEGRPNITTFFWRFGENIDE